jgi:AcrR family transcriptional regulator
LSSWPGTLSTVPRAPKSAAKKPRRTQEERRAVTRTALLDATIDCLIEYGYAGVTTTRVVERAGVSRGAQVHHFPTKAQLVSEAVGHLARRRTIEMAGEIAGLPRGAKRIEAVLDLLWRSHAGPLFQAALELWVAARTDPELAEALKGVDRQVNEQIWEGAEELFGPVARSKEFAEDLETSLAVMRGLALLLSRGTDPKAVEKRWKAARTRLLGQLEQHAPLTDAA